MIRKSAPRSQNKQKTNKLKLTKYLIETTISQKDVNQLKYELKELIDFSDDDTIKDLPQKNCSTKRITSKLYENETAELHANLKESLNKPITHQTPLLKNSVVCCDLQGLEMAMSAANDAKIDDKTYQEMVKSSSYIYSWMERESLDIAIDLVNDMGDSEWEGVGEIYCKMIKSCLYHRDIYKFVVATLENMVGIEKAKIILQKIDQSPAEAALQLGKLWLNVYHEVYTVILMENEKMKRKNEKDFYQKNYDILLKKNGVIQAYENDILRMNKSAEFINKTKKITTKESKSDQNEKENQLLLKPELHTIYEENCHKKKCDYINKNLSFLNKNISKNEILWKNELFFQLGDCKDSKICGNREDTWKITPHNIENINNAHIALKLHTARLKNTNLKSFSDTTLLYTKYDNIINDLTSLPLLQINSKSYGNNTNFSSVKSTSFTLEDIKKEHLNVKQKLSFSELKESSSESLFCDISSNLLENLSDTSATSVISQPVITEIKKKSTIFRFVSSLKSRHAYLIVSLGINLLLYFAMDTFFIKYLYKPAIFITQYSDNKCIKFVHGLINAIKGALHFVNVF